jgi:hypothetical protein
MNCKNLFYISMHVIILSGCTSTYSFAPPQVNVSKSVAQDGQNGCNLKSSSNSISTPSLSSARLMIDNFVLSYRCAATQLADGKRDFEIPALLAGVGGAAAAALGTGRDVAIATGTTAALFSGGKGYFSPQDKARIVSGGLDALLCIKTEAVGITALDVGRVEAATMAKMNSFAALRAAPPPSVNFSADRQYYELVTSALLSVENVMLQRLASIGTYAPDALISEINAVAKKLDEASDDGNKDDAMETAKTLADDMPTQKSIASTIIKLEELQPKLQACVIRAKT